MPGQTIENSVNSAERLTQSKAKLNKQSKNCPMLKLKKRLWNK